jgi:Family of unknown function (DUF695)
MLSVPQLIANDQWAGAEVHADGGLALIRFRTPVLGGSEMPGYPNLLTVVWAYDEEGSGALPDSMLSEEMATFENRICDAFEADNHAVLVAVLTFDGARQWVFYTGDVAECGDRLSRMPHDDGPYPIELNTREDAKWEYLRNEILASIDFAA